LPSSGAGGPIGFSGTLAGTALLNSSKTSHFSVWAAFPAIRSKSSGAACLAPSGLSTAIRAASFNPETAQYSVPRMAKEPGPGASRILETGVHFFQRSPFRNLILMAYAT
jgi:hypothetical protein